jgi:RNA polymerase sigma-70 factor (ECF subfamily)
LTENKIIRNQIKLAKEKNQNAFSYLLNTFWDDVYNFQLKRIKNESTAEDITIESFTKAFEKINTYNDKYIFKTWLITISKNLHIDKLRKNKNNFNLAETNEFKELKENSPSPEDDLINEQKLKSLKNKISQLKPSYKKVIELKYFNELSYKEISQKLNQPINNVKVRVMRAKRILAEIIKTHD